MQDNIHIKGISIENFRTIKFLETNNFGDINLITGKNNSGKTTLLEALFLCLGPSNPSLWMNINMRRGLSRVSPNESTATYLFYNLEVSTPINFKVKTLYQSNYDLKIELVKPTMDEIMRSTGTSSILEDVLDGDAGSIGYIENSLIVNLTFTPEIEPQLSSRTVIAPGKLNAIGNRQIFPNSVYVSSGFAFDFAQQAKRYSELDKSNLLPEFEKLLKIVEPSIKRTSLAVENDISMIHADIGFGLIPLTLCGSGIRRLTTILLALANSKNGIVLIDEIESGFHHLVLNKVWMAISEFVETCGCQVFATTHSDECVRAALKSFIEPEHIDFRLHRLDKSTEKSELHTFNKNQLSSAIESGWDVR